MIYQYKYKVNGLYPVSAEVAANEINSIQQEKGFVTPESVVDKSRPESATLHKCFEWNDEVAAEKWRVQQSRVLIGNIVRVTVQDNDEQEEKPLQVRAFVNAVNKFEGSVTTKAKYVQIETAMSNDEIRGIVLKNALRELMSFKEKYGGLIELSKMIEEIDRLVEGRASNAND